MEILPQLVWHYDEPFADSSAVPTWYLAQLTRQHVTVALTGDGGDELFAGYPRYLAVWLAELVRPLAGLAAAAVGRPLLAAAAGQPAAEIAPAALETVRRGASANRPQRRYLEWIAIFNEARRAALYSDDFLAALPRGRSAGVPRRRLRRRAAAATRSRRPAWPTWSTYLPCDLMTKVDIASMAHGLECRQPFLDHRVVELAARMPRRAEVPPRPGKADLAGGVRRSAAAADPPAAKNGLRRAAGPLVPPRTEGLRPGGAPGPADAGPGVFSPEAVRRLWDEHQQGRFDHSYRLWALLVLELWQRQWAG